MKNQKINILVIDDNRHMCETIKKAFTENGYNIKYITKPKQTLKVLKKKMYHLIILDLRMPEMRGEDLLLEIKKFYPGVSVIILTAYPTVDSAIQTLKNDAFDYIKKPFKIVELKSKVQEIVTSRKLDLDAEDALNLRIGNKLRGLRRGKNLTIKQLSEKTNLSTSLVSQIERAESAASISSLNKIVNALDIELKELFEEN